MKSSFLIGLVILVFGITMLLSRPVIPEGIRLVGLHFVSPSSYAIPVLQLALTILAISFLLREPPWNLRTRMRIIGSLQFLLGSLAILWNAILPVYFTPLDIYGIVGVVVGMVLIAGSFIYGG